ncbi:MAG TPA: hypothetical protein VKN99_24840 [Polyangia bacterium]|nr:hypothetical protein [Polyangia bacterium]
MKLTLLGPQGPQPTLRQALDAMAPQGPIALVTAGWQEREADDAELREQLGRHVVNLQLHWRTEEVFRGDFELAMAYRERQERLQHMQQSYRVRLDHAQEAARQVARLTTDAALLAQEWQVSLAGLRALDAQHLARCQTVHEEFEARLHPSERDSVAHQRQDIAKLLRVCGAVAIAGGHVAVLLNRMRLFGLGALMGDRPICAWSAGAMALAERVVLFHDDPPQGAPVAEVLDHGLGLAPAIVPLPHANKRLLLTDRDHVARFARRFAPAACIAMNAGAQVSWDGAGWSRASGIVCLTESGAADAGWCAAS